MKPATITPGPWEAVTRKADSGKGTIIDEWIVRPADKREAWQTVCVVGDGPNAAANAPLLASAPELRQALSVLTKAAYEVSHYAMDNQSPHGTHTGIPNALLKTLMDCLSQNRGAISKADQLEQMAPRQIAA